MNVLFFGATHGCGLEALILLLSSSSSTNTASVVARYPDAFAKTLQERAPELTADQAALTAKLNVIKGDALKAAQVTSAFEQAQQRFGKIDAVVFSIGGRPVFSKNPFSPLTLSPESICERASRNVTDALLALPANVPQPRLIVVSSNGLGKQGHALLPYLMRPLYSYLLPVPHKDKEQMEIHLHHLAGLKSDDFNPTPDAALVAQPKIKQLIIIRPALLLDGKATKKIRVDENLTGGYSISRADVGFFIYNSCLGGPEDKGQYTGKAVTLAY